MYVNTKRKVRKIAKNILTKNDLLSKMRRNNFMGDGNEIRTE